MPDLRSKKYSPDIFIYVYPEVSDGNWCQKILEKVAEKPNAC